MARAGRKRKQVQRQPNGQPSRKKEVIVREAANLVVLQQPHRRGNTDQRCATVFGRFCMRNKLRQELHDAGEEYAATVRRWRAAKGVPTPFHNEAAGGGRGPTDAQVEQWRRRLIELDRAMMAVSTNAYLGVRQILLDGNDVGMEQDGPTVSGLMAVAVELGMLPANVHPFTAGK